MLFSKREYPTLKGKDAEKFIERQKEHIRKLKEKILKWRENIND